MMAFEPKKRLCEAEKNRAIFHGWAELEKPVYEDDKVVGRYKNTMAVLEYDNGQVDFVRPNRIRFLDTGKVFKELEQEDIQ